MTDPQQVPPCGGDAAATASALCNEIQRATSPDRFDRHMAGLTRDAFDP
jgi:hypothetical protein